MSQHLKQATGDSDDKIRRSRLSPEQLVRFEAIYQAQRECGPRNGGVTIRCESEYHSRTARVAEFQRGYLKGAIPSGYGWAQVMSQSEYRERGWSAVHLNTDGTIYSDQLDYFGLSFRGSLFVRGGQLWFVETPEHFLAASGGRLRYELKCARCSENLVVRREKLCEALDLVVEAGASRVTIRELSAIVAQVGRKQVSKP